jgi:hypothetical protein
MQQFEYKILDFRGALHSFLTGIPEEQSDDWEREINDLGKDGWQLVSIISPPLAVLGMSTFIRLIFMRTANPHTN